MRSMDDLFYLFFHSGQALLLVDDAFECGALREDYWEISLDVFDEYQMNQHLAGWLIETLDASLQGEHSLEE